VFVGFDICFFENGGLRDGCVIMYGDRSDAAQTNESDGEHKRQCRHDENNEKFSECNFSCGGFDNFCFHGILSVRRERAHRRLFLNFPHIRTWKRVYAETVR
jgi:hypothetical protein